MKEGRKDGNAARVKGSEIVNRFLKPMSVFNFPLYVIILPIERSKLNIVFRGHAMDLAVDARKCDGSPIKINSMGPLSTNLFGPTSLRTELEEWYTVNSNVA